MIARYIHNFKQWIRFLAQLTAAGLSLRLIWYEATGEVVLFITAVCLLEAFRLWRDL